MHPQIISFLFIVPFLRTGPKSELQLSVTGCEENWWSPCQGGKTPWNEPWPVPIPVEPVTRCVPRASPLSTYKHVLITMAKTCVAPALCRAPFQELAYIDSFK